MNLQEAKMPFYKRNDKEQLVGLLFMMHAASISGVYDEDELVLHGNPET